MYTPEDPYRQLQPRMIWESTQKFKRDKLIIIVYPPRRKSNFRVKWCCDAEEACVNLPNADLQSRQIETAQRPGYDTGYTSL